MAQSTQMTGGQVRQLLAAENLAVELLASGNTQLLEVPVQGLARIAAEFAVTVQALDAFIIQAKLHPAGSWVTLYSAAGSYTSPAGLLVAASGDLTALAAAATGWFVLDVQGLYAIRVLASAAVNGALVDARVSGSSI